MMLSIADALKIVLLESRPQRPREMGLMERYPSNLDCIIGEDVKADRDSPPFSKSMMDGVAVRSADKLREYKLIGTILAGVDSSLKIKRGQAVKIMTGAPIPPGADAVVKIEDVEEGSDNRIRIRGGLPKANQHILHKGSEYKAGEIVLEKGLMITPPVYGILSSVGRTSVACYPSPDVAVLSTGNEIIAADQKPGPNQLRNSNTCMLIGQILNAGGIPESLGIARDKRKDLREKIEEGLGFEILIISGGVSMGTHDLVPQILEELGVEILFHKVAVKPGKPLLFGKHRYTRVFGLPGNPVSSFVGFELFVGPAIRRMRGIRAPETKTVLLPLMESLITNHDRPTYLPGQRVIQEGRVWVRALPWTGSANLHAYREADTLIAVPPGKVEYAGGEMVSTLEIG